MKRTVLIAALALMASLAASSSTVTPHVNPLRLAAAPGTQTLYVIGSRGPVASVETAKFDGALGDLVRHAPLARPGQLLRDLHALSPAARFTASSTSGAALVGIDAVTRGDPRALEAALVSLGLEHPALYGNDVSGFLPVSALPAAAARAEVLSLRAALARRRAVGPVATQGDFAQQSTVARTQSGLTGAGVTVGIISDSFNCYAVYAAPGSGVPASGPEGYASNGFTADYANDVASGALPASVEVVAEPNLGSSDCLGYQNPDSANQPTGLPFADEGRAMTQIVYSVAPGAKLAFRTGSVGEADFATGIKALAAAPYHAKVIMDDLGYFDEPFFQDGIVAQAIDAVKAAGVAYFSAAGNNQETPSYYNTTPSFGTIAAAGAPNAGEKLLNFDASGKTTVTSLPVTIPALVPGDFVAIVVEWDQPYVTGAPGSGGATSQIDVCISGSTSGVLLDYDNQVKSCSGPVTPGTDPYQIMLIANPAVGSSNTAQQTIQVEVGLANGSAAPRRIIVAVEDDGQGSTINQFSPSGPMLQGHPGAAGAAAVGAAFYFDTPACGTSPATLEKYSAAGGLPVLFDAAGARLATPVVRQKPDFVGPDGINNTFLGFTLASAGIGTNGMLSTSTPQCQNNASYPNFFGTSAATPHVGAIAALMLEANASMTPDDVYGALRASALAMPVSGSLASCTSGQPNYCSGYGFIQATKALVSPAINASLSSVAPGGSVDIGWLTARATGCSLSASPGNTVWTGTQPPQGSLSVTVPSTAGTATFAMSCTDSAGNLGSNQVTLNVQPVPATPTLTLAASSVEVGGSTTISWSSSGATSCSASGSWSGSFAASGQQTLTPTVAGTATYSMTCSNPTGSSAKASAVLTVTPAPGGGGGGGGGLGATTALGLLGLWGLRRRHALIRP